MNPFLTPLSYFSHLGFTLRGGAVALLLLPFGAAAQTGSGSVSGTLVEEGTNQPVPFSDVLLLRAADSTFVAVAQTSERGGFKALALPYGTYLLRVQDLNYRVLRRRFNLTAAMPTMEFPALKMSAATATKLQEVVVTGQKATVVEELGKRVINVEKDLGSIGGTAANVLQNVPSVSVDANGTVSMRGTSNLTILIDGKPAGVSNGGGGGQRLDQIPASRIAQVEIITNPSAKYDAAGGGGVINIITKKDHKDGTNGTAAVNLGTQDKYSASLSLSRKQGKVTWQAAYDGRDVTYQSHGHTEQIARLLQNGAPATVQTTQNGIGSERHENHTLTVGADFELPKNQTLSLSVQPGIERNLESESQLLTQRIDGGPVASTRGQQDLDVKVKLLEYSGNYRRTWEKHEGRELTANFGGVVIDAKVPVVQRQFAEAGSPAVPQPGTRQQLDLLGNIQFGQIDYVHPLTASKGRLEAGVKIERQTTRGSNGFGYATSESTTSPFVEDPARSLTYTFAQVVPAGYVTLQRPLGKSWSAQVGVRGEFTHNGGTIEGGLGIDQRGSLAQNYFNLFPSATLSRELGKEAGQNRLQLSYARRLDRPNFMQQLPLAIYQDPRSYRLGNARLTAEYSHNIELGHQLTLGQATLTTTLFARITTDAIQRYRSVDAMASNLAGFIVTRETYLNNGRTTNLGAEFSLSQPLAKWWKINTSASLYRAQFASNSIGNNQQALVGSMRLTNNFTVRPTLDVQLSGNLRSAQLTAQGRQLAQGQIDLALRQRLFGDRAALTLRVSDLLNTQQNRSEIETDALRSYRYSKDESRVGWVGFTWYIGASKPGKKIEAAPQGGGGGFGG